jgi:hypothetical protein
MNVISQRMPEASSALHEKLSCSRVGQRWERILRAHTPELDGLMAVHADLRDHVVVAVRGLAESDAVVARLDDTTVGAISRVLDDLQRLGGLELQRSVTGMRDELAMARGRSLDDVLAG